MDGEERAHRLVEEEELARKALAGEDRARKLYEEEKARKAAARERVAKEKAEAEAKKKEEERQRKLSARERLLALRNKKKGLNNPGAEEAALAKDAPTAPVPKPEEACKTPATHQKEIEENRQAAKEKEKEDDKKEQEQHQQSDGQGGGQPPGSEQSHRTEQAGEAEEPKREECRTDVPSKDSAKEEIRELGREHAKEMEEKQDKEDKEEKEVTELKEKKEEREAKSDKEEKDKKPENNKEEEEKEEVQEKEEVEEKEEKQEKEDKEEVEEKQQALHPEQDVAVNAARKTEDKHEQQGQAKECASIEEDGIKEAATISSEHQKAAAAQGELPTEEKAVTVDAEKAAVEPDEGQQTVQVEGAADKECLQVEPKGEPAQAEKDTKEGQQTAPQKGINGHATSNTSAGAAVDRQPCQSRAFSRLMASQEALRKKASAPDSQAQGARSAATPVADPALAADNLEQAGLEFAAFSLEEALEKAESARLGFASLETPSAQLECAKAGKLSVQIHIERDDGEAALKVAEALHEHTTKSSSSMAQALSKSALAAAHASMDRWKEAARWGSTAIAELAAAKDEAAHVAALQQQVSVDLKIDTCWSRVRALKGANEAVELCRGQLNDGKAEAETLLLLSAVHTAKQEFELAYSHADAAVSRARMVGDKRCEAKGLAEVATVLLAAKDDAGVALQATLEAVDLMLEIGDPAGEISARHAAAKAAVQAGKTVEALEMLDKALAQARSLKHPRKIDSTLHEIMQIHTRSGGEDGDGAEKALAAIVEEASLAQESGDCRRDLAASQKLASFFLALGRLDDALRTATDTEQRLSQAGDQRVTAWAVQLLAEVHVARKSFTEAMEAANKAHEMLEEAQDIRSAVALLKLIFEVQVEQGNDRDALSTYLQVRNTYRDAGWKDEEVEALLVIVHLQHTLKGPKEAMRIAKEAVELCQVIKDIPGEARSTLELAGLQLACKASTEALRSTSRAEKLFKSIEDASGEAQALQAAASIYLENGAWEEAVRVMKDAVEVCRKAGEKREELHAITKLIELHTYLAQSGGESEAKAGMGGRRPRAVQDAMTATLDLLKLVRSMGDLPAQCDALAQLSGLHLMNKDSEAALETAKECLDVAVAIDEPIPVGKALCLVAQAFVALGDMEQATQAADEAKSVFQLTGDQENMDLAEHIVEDAKSRMETMRQQSASAGGGQKAQSGAAGWNNLQHVASKGPSQLGSAHQPKMKPMPKSAVRFDTSAADDDDADRGPDQDARRRQLLASDQSGPTVVPAVSAGIDELGFERITAASQLVDDDSFRAKRQLRSVLHRVRPDWKDSELAAVQEKLGSIGIHNAPGLFRLLRRNGAAGLNRKLKEVGQKQLKAQTLEELRDYGDSLEPEVID